MVFEREKTFIRFKINYVFLLFPGKYIINV